ncbi:CHAT domain-containing protein [Trichocoleus sp. FACHB-262]|nr:CHAT domain-containing protein [Trichocoleus sp. FACHB-262]MBD2119498.1 CHAT domain-containing protein [Trichocoleus sp. FACHB-262]
MLSAKLFAALLFALALPAGTILPIPEAIAQPTATQKPATPNSVQKTEADQLQKQGFAQLEAREFAAAEKSWQQALQIYRSLGDREGEFLILYCLGLLHYTQQEIPPAASYYEQGVKLARQWGDAEKEWQMLSTLGTIYASVGENKQALSYQEPALALAQKLKDVPKQAQALESLIKTSQELGDFAQVKTYQQQQAAIAAQLPSSTNTLDPTMQALKEGQALLIQGSGASVQQAIAKFEQARVSAKKNGERQQEILALLALGAAHDSLGQKQPALEAYKQALPLAQQSGDRYSQATILVGMGQVYNSTGQLELALATFNQALPILKEIKNRAGEGTVLNNMGNISSKLGNYAQALNYHRQSLAIAQSTGDHTRQNRTLNNMGLVYSKLGQYQAAFDAFNQALASLKADSDRFDRATTLANLGTVYSYVGQLDQALESFQQALAVLKEADDPGREAYALANIGSVYYDRRDYEPALDYYQRSLKLLRQVQDAEGESTVLNNIGLIYDDLKQPQLALTYYNQGLAIAQKTKDPAGEATTLINLGRTHYTRQDYAKAASYQAKAATLAQKIGNQRVAGYALGNLGRAQLAAKQLTAAETSLLASAQAWESLRASLGDDDRNKISLFEEQTSTYRLLQKALAAQNKPEAALEAAERGRARAFVELLAERLPTQADAVAKIQPPNLAQIRAIAKQHNTTLVEYSVIDDDERNVNGEPLRESELFIWVIQPNGKVDFRRVDLKPLWQKGVTPTPTTQPLKELVARSRSSIGVRGLVFQEDAEAIARATADANAAEAENKRLQQLHQLLIEPIADLLPKDPNAHVTFIPQQFLFLVPFVALQDANGKYLIEKHTVLIAPSIQVLDLTHQQRQRLQAARDKKTDPLSSFLPSPSSLIVGNPTMPSIRPKLGEPAEQLASLPGAEKEAKAIATLLRTQALIGDQATKAKILQQLPQAQIVHLATHGLLDDFKGLGVPGAIALAPSGQDDGLLTASEILKLKLNAELVVLSACDTGQGRITGDGVVGLSRSLISAGVPSVIVSLWKVPDEPTAALMTEFYRQLQRQPDKAQALRQAMLVTKARYPDPLDWAAFTLMGEAE